MRLSVLLIMVCAGSAAQAQLETIQTPTTQTLNGLAAVPGRTFAVGNGGTIVHIDTTHPSGVLVPSGTSENLFDVFARSQNLAIVSGNNRLLLWDGDEYATLVQLNDNPPSALLPVWISPDRAAAQYAIAGTGGAPSILCTQSLDGDPSPAFCRAGALPIAFCGDSENFMFVDQRGDIINLQRNLDAAIGAPGDGTLFSAPVGQHMFSAAWLMPGSCSPIQDLSIVQAFAVDHGQSLVRFDGTQWQTLGSVQPGQNLTWLGGTSPTNVVAVGFEPDAANPGQNIGVTYTWDGNSWAEYGLPMDVPGLADVFLVDEFGDLLFGNGFSGVGAPPLNTPKRLKHDCGKGNRRRELQAAGEKGKVVRERCQSGGSELVDSGLLKTDVALALEQVGPIRGATTMLIRVTNNGPDDVVHVPIHGRTFLGHHIADNCPGMSVQPDGLIAGFSYMFEIAALPDGATVECSLQIDPLGATRVSGRAMATTYTDHDPRNNSQAVSVSSTQMARLSRALRNK